MNKMNLFEYLKDRQAVSFEQYQDLHNKNLKTSINNSKGFALDRIETENPDLRGARYYTFNG